MYLILKPIEIFHVFLLNWILFHIVYLFQFSF